MNGVHRAGLFVSLDETGADGLVPMSMMGDDRFDFDGQKQWIKGRSTGVVYTIGNAVTVRLEQANVHTGSMAFSIADNHPARPATPPRKGKASKKPNKNKGKRKHKPKKPG